MAKNLAKVLKADIPRLPLRRAAEELRKKGRGRDTILAHITPREAAKLKAEGGRGSINPDTGLPEFEDSFFFDPTPISYQPADFSSFEAPPYTPESITQAPVSYTGPDYTTGMQNVQGLQDGYLYQTPIYNTFQQPFQAGQYTGYFQPGIDGELSLGDQYASAKALNKTLSQDDALRKAYITGPARDASGRIIEAPVAPSGGEALKAAAQQQRELLPVLTGQAEEDATTEMLRQAEAEKAAALAEGKTVVPGVAGEGAGTADRAVGKAKEGMVDTPFGSISTKNLIAALGLGALGLNYMRGQSQGKQAAQQLQAAYNQAAAQSRELAQPYMQQGGQQLGQALTGALSPAQQQQLSAAQAQAAQQTASSGGVAAAQAGRSVEDLRQRLLASQQTMALRLLGTGTPLISQAIKDQLSGTTTGIDEQLRLSQLSGQAASGMLSALIGMYARG